jgi:hypothetical protein
VRNLTIIATLLIAFNVTASSDIKEIPLSGLTDFGVVIQQRGISENRSDEFNLLLGVPKQDVNKCTISGVEISIIQNGKFIAYNFLADSFEISEHYSSHIIASKSDVLSLNVGARYNCQNLGVPTVFYNFGDLGSIEKHYINNGLLSEI